MGKYESIAKGKEALDKLEKSLLNFKKEFPSLNEFPSENQEFYSSALNIRNKLKEFTRYIVEERGKYKREEKNLKSLMDD